jgi:stage II sporulation protein D
MKDSVIAVAIFVALLVLIPFVFAETQKNVNSEENIYAQSDDAMQSKKNASVFFVRDSKTGAERSEDGYSFICGVVAGEMPASYEPEALKAQAVAAFSYCCYKKEQTADGGYVVTGKDVAYLSRNDAQKLWNRKFAENWGKIADAVRAVFGKAIFYEGRVIEANYCDMSSGVTESSKDVYGLALPYLVEVTSPGDRQAKGYLSRVRVPLAMFIQKVTDAFSAPTFDTNPQNAIRVLSRSQAGGVVAARLCGTKVTGREIRAIFSLRSANFTVSFQDGAYVFTVRGNGHGVGMSQCGAEYMARQGKSWQEILGWYYRGTTIGDYLSGSFCSGSALSPVKESDLRKKN